MGKIDRRTFLRCSAVATTTIVATACDPGVTPPNVVQPTTAPAVSPPALAAPSSKSVQIALSGNAADVWAWQRDVQGAITGDCTELFLQAGNSRIDLRRDGEQFTAQVPLRAGENRVVAVCRRQDGQETRSNALTYTVRLSPRPTAIISLAIQDDRIVLDGSTSRTSQAGNAQITSYRWSFRDSNPAEIEVENTSNQNGAFEGQRLHTFLPQAEGEYYVTLRIADSEGREDAATNYFVVENGQPRIPNYDTENPAWVENAVVYGTIPRKFGDPAFQGVIDRLDYLKDLGVDALWLAPINKSPAGDYGYAVIDYFDVNPDFGTKDDFKRLVSEAHARGIRILMDFVPNHSSAEHPYFVDAQQYGQESPYYTFYDRDAQGNPTYYFDWKHLPNLNYNNAEVERFMLEAFSYWVREFDVDGFRVDVAWGITERKPDFWLRWRRELKRIKPDLLLLAEASARDPFYFDNGFDAAYDWTAAVGKWAWELVWESKTLITYNLHSALTNNEQGFHPDALIFRFLNNNDTGTRFITDQGEEMTRVATALLLTLPGIPCVYTGDEIGAWFRPYFDELPMSWNEDKYPGLRNYHKQLIALRHANPSLHSRQWLPVDVETKQQVYGYVRYVNQNTDPVLVLLNFTDKEAEVQVTLPEQFASLNQDSLRDLLTEELVVLTGTPLTLTLPPWRVMLLTTG